MQIRAVSDRAWEFIALAYKGRAFLALGYACWDDYVDARFGDFRIAVPREHRAEVVASLAGVRMSVRAIAKIMGVGVGTVHRELVRSAGGAGHPSGDAGESAFTLGRDGKEYPRHRTPSEPCRTCGEQHPAGRCPARGISTPRASVRTRRPEEDVIYGHPDVIPIKRKPRATARRRTAHPVGIGDLSETPVDRRGDALLAWLAWSTEPSRQFPATTGARGVPDGSARASSKHGNDTDSPPITEMPTKGNTRSQVAYLPRKSDLSRTESSISANQVDIQKRRTQGNASVAAA